MKKVSIAALMFLLVLVLGAQAHATVVTFEDAPDGPVVDGYGGINWGGVWTNYSQSQFPYTPHSGTHRAYANTDSFEVPFSFVTPDAQFNGAWISGYAFATVQFILYNDSLAVWSSAVLTPSDIPTFLASGYTGAVDKVGVLSPGQDFYVMDDVTYSAGNPIPEPTTLTLLGGGIVALYARSRRRPR